MKESLFKNNNQINSTIRTRTWVLWTKWTRIWLITVLVSEWKNGVCLNGLLKYVWVLYHINKVWWVYAFSSFWRDVANAIFLKYSKEGRVSSSHIRIWNISSDFCWDDTKNLQVQSEHKHIHNPFKHLTLSVFG